MIRTLSATHTHTHTQLDYSVCHGDAAQTNTQYTYPRGTGHKMVHDHNDRTQCRTMLMAPLDGSPNKRRGNKNRGNEKSNLIGSSSLGGWRNARE